MSTTVEVRSAIVRESFHFGPCNLLGPLVAEAPTRYFYQRHPGGVVAFAQRSPRIHLEPCRGCPDHPASRFLEKSP